MLADTLAADFDTTVVLGLLAERCRDLFDVAACGLLLADENNDAVDLAAASDRDARTLEQLQLTTCQGPALDCFRAGSVVVCHDLVDAWQRWPRFAPVAVADGFRGAHVLPLRLRDQVLGTLGLYTMVPGPLERRVLALGQGLADMAAIGLVNWRILRGYETTARQLRTALDSRILIEQAKGVLAERMRIDVDAAFAILRAHARATNRKLVDAAAGVVDGSLPLLGAVVERRGNDPS
ncbi:GAF and ANTAR domain-containing protein [Saccharothrix violaceirubra]